MSIKEMDCTKPVCEEYDDGLFGLVSKSGLLYCGVLPFRKLVLTVKDGKLSYSVVKSPMRFWEAFV